MGVACGGGRRLIKREHLKVVREYKIERRFCSKTTPTLLRERS